MSYSFRTLPPSDYFPPSRWEMAEAAKRVGLGKFSPGLVEDLCNVATGGQIVPPSEYHAQVSLWAKYTLPEADEDGDWPTEHGYTEDRNKAIEYRTLQTMDYHQRIVDFVKSIDFATSPGASPLEQAMGVLKHLSMQKDEPNDGGCDMPLPIFKDTDLSAEMPDNFQSLMEIVDSLSAAEREMMGIAQPAPGNPHRGIEDLQVRQVAENLLKDDAKKLRILQEFLHWGKSNLLQAQKQNKSQEDPGGEDVQHRQMRHAGELFKVTHREWANRQLAPTYFLYRLATNQLTVSERISKMKKAIFILLDGSGSFDGIQHQRATGIAIQELEAVIRGDSVVWLSVFDNELSRAEYAETPAQAKMLRKKLTEDGNFSGGGTNIAAAVRAAHKIIQDRIKAGQALFQPEVWVITDDDNSISQLDVSDIPGTTVHGIVIEDSNPDLAKVVKATGGQYLEI